MFICVSICKVVLEWKYYIHTFTSRYAVVIVLAFYMSIDMPQCGPVFATSIRKPMVDTVQSLLFILTLLEEYTNLGLLFTVLVSCA